MKKASEAYERLSLAMLTTDPSCRDEALYTADDLIKDDKELLAMICSDCPLFNACDEYARLARPKAGVWAGKTYRSNAPRKATDE